MSAADEGTSIQSPVPSTTTFDVTKRELNAATIRELRIAAVPVMDMLESWVAGDPSDEEVAGRMEASGVRFTEGHSPLGDWFETHAVYLGRPKEFKTDSERGYSYVVFGDGTLDSRDMILDVCVGVPTIVTRLEIATRRALSPAQDEGLQLAFVHWVGSGDSYKWDYENGGRFCEFLTQEQFDSFTDSIGKTRCVTCGTPGIAQCGPCERGEQ